LTNLLLNAVESYDGVTERQRIRVTLDSGEGWISITIQDFGCGMSDEVLSDATVLFSTNKPHGPGFGLPLALKIIETEHAGRLTITSHKGQGTAVRMVLPKRRPGETL
jgi:signal transduction histidine kinase